MRSKAFDTTDQTIRVLYPFASNLHSIDKTRPFLTIGENILDTKLHVGTYAGGFQGAWENWKETHQNPGTLNLQGFESWEGYQSLKGVSGYDVVTALGSNLHFTQQTARLEDRGQIEIVRQNFGFDLANGINEVILDMTNPHYYLEVKSIKTEE